MTQLKKISNFFREYRSTFRREQYLKINLILAGVVVIVFAYSGIFSPDTNNYPVVCMHEKLTGESCFSCGLSHSFSLILRGRIAEAYEWNRYGLQVFFFFLFQLLLRIAFSVFYVQNPGNRKRLILIDIAGSIMLFIIAFFPFLKNIVTNI
jgi:preprotein translocase subunit SecY